AATVINITRLPRDRMIHHSCTPSVLYPAGKPSSLRSFVAEDRNIEMIAYETPINFEHLPRLRPCFSFSFVNGMPFLPEEFGRAQEEAWPHFPPDNVRPLIDQNGKIAVRLHPLCVAGADNCFRSRPNHQRLSQRAR